MMESRKECSACDGAGVVDVLNPDDYQHAIPGAPPMIQLDCAECGGTGYVVTVLGDSGPLTPARVAEMVDAIRSLIHDPEAAHSAEDRMRSAVLEAIADGSAYDPQNCAVAALESDDIDFGRWTA